MHKLKSLWEKKKFNVFTPPPQKKKKKKKKKSNFSVKLILSFANALNLDKSKILPFVNPLPNNATI